MPLAPKKLKNGNYEVGVHIADVSFYVTPDSVLDKEAYIPCYIRVSRGPHDPDAAGTPCPTGCVRYVPTRKNFVSRRFFELNDKAEVVNQWFGRTIIKSNRRFTYEEAQAMIEGGEGDYKEEILTLNDLKITGRPFPEWRHRF